MNIVLDTNVLVSGLLTPFGPSGEIVRLVSAGALVVQYDARILLEYRDVLFRPKFQFDRQAIDVVLDYIRHSGQAVCAQPLHQRLPDPDDEPFLEIAVSGQATGLITGNQKHFPKHLRQNVTVFSPAEFIDFYRTFEKFS
jgi:uncharacterized protein